MTSVYALKIYFVKFKYTLQMKCVVEVVVRTEKFYLSTIFYFWFTFQKFDQQIRALILLLKVPPKAFFARLKVFSES